MSDPVRLYISFANLLVQNIQALLCGLVKSMALRLLCGLLDQVLNPSREAPQRLVLQLDLHVEEHLVQISPALRRLRTLLIELLAR